MGVTSMGSFIARPEAGAGLENLSAILGDFIGGVTLTGSLVAFGKLHTGSDGKPLLASKPLNLPGKNFLNLAGLFLFIGLVYHFLSSSIFEARVIDLSIVAALACIMGVHLVGSVGGGDMPVCITVLNSYSGWALVAEGMLLGSPTLTVVGSLIGFSGAILTKIMCDAMNRDIINVIFGGMQAPPPKKLADGEVEEVKEHREIQPDAVASMLQE